MAFLSHVARKVQNSFTFTNIPGRAYSEMTSAESCFIMGKHGPITLPSHRMISLDEHFQKQPLLSPVTADRLIDIDAQRPYVSDDISRRLYSSGLSLPFFAGLRNESYSGAFRKDNVGVIEDLQMFGFKELAQDEQKIWIKNKSEGFNEYGVLLQGLLDPFKSHDGANVDPPVDVESFLAKLSASQVDTDLIMVDAATLSDLQYAQIAQEVYRILFEEYPVHQNSSLPYEICRDVGEGSDQGTLSTCQKHAYLNAFLQMHWRNPSLIPPNQLSKYNTPGLGTMVRKFFSGRRHEVWCRIGALLIRLNRHMGVHPVKQESADTYTLLPTKSATNLLNTPPTRAEAIQLARYEFGNSLQLCLSAFKKRPAAWKLLDVRKHVPVPSIYFG